MDVSAGDDERAVGRQTRDPMRQYKIWVDNILAEDDPDWSKLYQYIVVPSVDPNRTAPDTKNTTLHRCAYDGEKRVLSWCLSRNAEVDAKNTLGRTALHYACESNRAECVRLLLEANADCNALTLSGSTPLHFCCQSNSYEAMMELFNSDSILDLDAEDTRWRIPEMLTTKQEMLAELKSYRASLDGRRNVMLARGAILALVGKQSTWLVHCIFSVWRHETISKKSGESPAPTHTTQDVPAAEPTKYVPPYAQELSAPSKYVPPYAQQMGF